MKSTKATNRKDTDHDGKHLQHQYYVRHPLWLQECQDGPDFTQRRCQVENGKGRKQRSKAFWLQRHCLAIKQKAGEQSPAMLALVGR